MNSGDATIDAATRSRVIAGVLRYLRAYYLYPNSAEEIARTIEQRMDRGDYDAVTNASTLCDTLTVHVAASPCCQVTREGRMLHEQRFNTGTVAINYVEGPPSGPPFVLLHAGGTRWQDGEALISLLSARWHIYAPDLRGHGKSGRAPGHYRLRDYAMDVAAFLTHVVTEPAVLFGHSLSGTLAAMVAAQHPQSVRALVVGDTAPFAEAHAS